MRAVKKRRRRLKKQISIGLTVFCLLAAGCMALLLTPLFNVSTVTVTGNTTIGTEAIVKGSGIVKGTNIFSVSLSAVTDRLSGMNGVSAVKVKRSLPSTIRISITEGVPMVYVENGGSFVGITADGKVVDVAEAGSAAAAVIANPLEREPDGEADSETGETDGETDENTDEETDGETDGETGEADGAASSPKGTGSGRTVVYGMGAFTYSVGKEIAFEDQVKARKLELLMSDFLGDDICRGFTQVDMAAYDNITMVYQGRLKVRLGDAEDLDYKLRCFKTIITENLGEDPVGLLDLERLTYNPKK